MQTELRQARNVAIVVGVGLLLLIIGALIWGQSGTHDDQSVTIGNDTKLTLLSGSSLKTIDADFWRYTDERLGFAMDIPKSMWYYALACEKNEDGYYYLAEGKAPTRVYQDTGAVTIAPQYSYILQNEEVYMDENGYTLQQYKSCQKIDNTISRVNDQYMGWKIISQTVANEDELNAFLRRYYGDSCHVGELTPASQEGVFDVSIGGDGLSLDETHCFINQVVYTKYSPTLQRVITWLAGQEATYWADGPDERSAEDYKGPSNYDQRMVDSVEILPAN